MAVSNVARDPEAERARFESEMRRIEGILKADLGLAFGHRHLLHHAFQHRSFQQENVRAQSYERLEFLGDRVLELCVSAWLFKSHPDEDEGYLSQEIAWRVDEANLARAEDRMHIKKAIRLGHSLVPNDISDRIVADVVEAMIGAIYLEFDLDAAWRFIEAYVPLSGDPPESFRATNQLLEACRAMGLDPPQFIEVEEGPDDQALWKVECAVGELRTTGIAKQKREARKMACREMLPLLSGNGL